MIYRNILILFISLLLPACASTPQGLPNQSTALAPSPSSPRTPLVTHAVAKGETLWRIAKIYHIDLDQIAKANNIPDSGSISVGQTLVIPDYRKTTQPRTNVSSRSDDQDFVWPAKGKIITYFRQKCNGVSSKGIDILLEEAQDIVASRDGQIIFIGKIAGYGETIIIDHKDGLRSVYCGGCASSVKLGDDIRQGAVLAKGGSSPRNDKQTLHFEIRRKNRANNPLFYLN